MAFFSDRPRYRVPISTMKMSDEYLASLFGEADWHIARDFIEQQRKDVEEGIRKDWERLREYWDRNEPPTDGQIRYLIDCHVDDATIRSLTKYEASFVIDELVLIEEVKYVRKKERLAIENKAKREAEAAAKAEKKRLKEEARAAKAAEREAEKEAKRLAREAARAAHAPKVVPTEKLAMWREELKTIWNGVMADDVITTSELKVLGDWLKRHKRSADDYKELLSVIKSVKDDGKLNYDDTMYIYDRVVEVFKLLES